MALLGSSPLGLTAESTTSASNNIGTHQRGQVLSDVNLYKSIFQNNGFVPATNYTNGDINAAGGDDSYDVSVSSLLEYTDKYPSMRLLASDFAYLKNLGVYPNNRLMVARRFPSGVPNDLTTISAPPLATLISWVPDGEDFIEVTYGEHWVDSEASFKEILNEAGKDLTTTGIGNIAAGGGGAIPLPGFMEGLQYDIMKRMGLVDDAKQIPAGNPNLIREAKMRKTMKDGEAGAGVHCDFDIKMVVTYEQKFYAGVSPTLVYFDIVANLLSFGTSDSYFQFNNKFGKGVSSIINDLISGDVARITNAIGKFVKEFISAIQSFVKDLISKISSVVSDSPDVKTMAQSFANGLKDALVSPVIKKYKIRLIGVANALTGTTSTPWHITIGNPKRPMFSSGDMLIADIKLTMGAMLAYNDLPAIITAEMTFKNARSLGGDEIYEKFNNGAGRSSKRLNLSLVEYSHGDNPDGIDKTYSPTERVNPNKVVERGQIEPVSNLTPVGVNSLGQSQPVLSGTLVAPDAIAPLNIDEIPPVPVPKVPSRYNWSVVLVNSGGAVEHASGVALTEADAQSSITTFATGATIKDQSIVGVV